MSGRVFDGRIAQGIAPDDRARQDRLKATARALVTAVRDGLVRDGVVRLHGFGTFRLRPIAARRGRHPRTGEPIDIPAGWRVMFRPAKALRERIEPDRAPTLPIGEPHASREAMLAAGTGEAAPANRRGAGWIPAGGPPAVSGRDEPRRAAAAAMPEPRRSIHGPIPPGPTTPAEPVNLEADSRVTRSPAALTRAPAASEPPQNEPPPNEAAPAEPPPAEPAAASPETRPKAEADIPGAGRGYRFALLVLLVLLLAGLAWLLRPVDAPAPSVADETATSMPDQAPADAGSGAQDIAMTADASQEPENPAATADSTATQDDTGDPVGRVDDAPADSTASAADERVEPAPATGDDETGGALEADSSGSGGTIDGADGLALATASTGAPDAEVPAPSTEYAATTDDGAPAALSRANGAATPASDDSAAEAAEDARGGTAPAGEGATGVTQAPATVGDAVGMPASDGSPYFKGRDYSVRSGDTLWDLADRHYVNPYYWPHIWQHNADIANPDRLEVRQGIWLPTLEGDPRSLTEADRRSIAEGYLLLYRFFREQGDANPQYALVGVRYFDPSVLPERLRGTAAGHPGDTLAAVFQARLEAEFPFD